MNDLPPVVPRHGGRKAHHPRLLLLLSAKTWMPTSVGMTVRRIDHESELLANGITKPGMSSYVFSTFRGRRIIRSNSHAGTVAMISST